MRSRPGAPLLGLMTLLGACGERTPDRTPAPPSAEPAALTSSTAIAAARAEHFGESGRFERQGPGLAGGADDRLFAAAPDDRGRLVAVGASAKRGRGSRAVLVRFKRDGGLDETFGGGDGVVLGPNDGSDDAFDHGDVGNDSFFAVRIDARGRILAAGRAGLGGRAKSLLARYLPDGKLDDTFGDLAGRGPRRRGYVVGMGDEYLDDQFSGVPPERSWPDERFASVDLDSAGRIVAAGTTADLNSSWLASTRACSTWLPTWMCRRGFHTTLVARFTPDGALDTSFNKVGYLTGLRRPGGLSGRHDELLDAHVISGDAIAAVGFVGREKRDDEPLERRTLVTVVQGDGSFAEELRRSEGILVGPERARAGGAREELRSVSIDRRRRLVLAGTSWDAGGAPHVFVARLGPNLNHDAAFGQSGQITDALPGTEARLATRVDAAGRILVAGAGGLRRFGTEGSEAETFTLPSDAACADVAVDHLDKIWVVGSRSGQLFAARFRDDGCPDGEAPCTR